MPLPEELFASDAGKKVNPAKNRNIKYFYIFTVDSGLLLTPNLIAPRFLHKSILQGLRP